MIRTKMLVKVKAQCAMKCYIIGVLLIACTISSAQSSTSSSFRQGDDLTDNRPNIIVTLSSGIINKGRVSHEAGDYNIHSTYQPYWELGGGRQLRVSKYSYFTIGFKGIVSGRNASFKAPVKKVNPVYREPRPPLRSGDFDFILGLPVRYGVRFLKRRTGSFFADIGADLRYAVTYDLDEYIHTFYQPNQTSIDVFCLRLNTNNNRSPWVTYCFSGGYEWRLKNKRAINLGVVANYSATEYAKGTYLINIPGHSPSSGQYGSTGTSLGLTCSYKFNFNRYKMEKLQQRSF